LLNQTRRKTKSQQLEEQLEEQQVGLPKEAILESSQLQQLVETVGPRRRNDDEYKTNSSIT
jgi:hypothetical protein